MFINSLQQRLRLVPFVLVLLPLSFLISSERITFASDVKQLEAEESQENFVEIKLKKARDLTNLGKLSESIEIYLEILKKDPQNFLARQELALVYAYNKNYQESIELYDRLTQEQPNNLTLRLKSAEIKSWAERYRDSLNDYQAIIEEHPDNLEALIGHAKVLSWAEKYEASLKEYEAILETHPNNYQAIKGKAEVTYWLGENQEAISLYQSALQQYPNDPKLEIGLAEVYYSEKFVSKAIELIQPQLDAKNPEALELLAEIRAWQSETKFLYEDNNSGEENFFLEQTIGYRVNDSDNLYKVKAGYGTFEQPGIESINNYSVELGLERRFEPLLFETSFGVDFFDRITASPKFNIGADIPLTANLNLDTDLNFKSFQDNAATLENEVYVWSLEPNLVWQIDRDSWVYLLYRLGLYDDGNLENQVGFGLGRNFGQFFIGANVFYWSYQDDLDNGYFDPSDFFSYNGEIGWEGKVFDFSKCRLSASIGRQSFAGDVQDGNTYQAGCTLMFSPNSELNVRYRYTNNARFQNSESGDSEQESLSGTLQFLF
jgi:tetratricopeptide (TPR) repeat protein